MRASTRRCRKRISGSRTAGGSTSSSGWPSALAGCGVTRLWQRCSPSCRRRRPRSPSSSSRSRVFWIESLGWPMAKGRDTWDYLAYYLQLFDSAPPLSELQVFRTPLTPIVVGLPLDLGGIWLLELVFAPALRRLDPRLERDGAPLRAHSGSVQRAPAARLPGLRDPLPPGLERRGVRDRARRLGASARACARRALDRSLRRARRRAGGPRSHPAREPGPAAAGAPRAARRAARVAASARAAGACVLAAALPLAAWAVHNGIRYDDTTVARGGRAWVPFLQVFTSNGTISPENGPASERLGALIEEQVLSREPHAGLDVTLDAYLRNGSNYETVRLIALSDSVLGRDENYDVLFDSALEAIREHPGRHFRGVADTFWEFLRQKPLREGIAPRAQTEPAPPAPTYESDGDVLPNPQATVLVPGCRTASSGARPTTSTRARSPIRRRPGRIPRRRSATARSSRRCARGTWSSPRARAGASSRSPQPDHAAVSDAGPVARRRSRRAPLEAAARLAAIVLLWLAAASSCSSTRRRRGSLPSSRCRSTRCSS